MRNASRRSPLERARTSDRRLGTVRRGPATGRSYAGPSSASDRAGTSATTSPPHPDLETSTVDELGDHRDSQPPPLHTACTSSSLKDGRSRACVPVIRSSGSRTPASLLPQRHGVEIDARPHAGARRGLAHRARDARRRRDPAAPRAARSRISSSDASISSFSANGSPIWTLGRARLGASLDRRAREHGDAADPVPTRRRAVQDHERPDVRREARGGDELVGLRDADAHHVDGGFAECGSANRISPPTVGTPMQLP